MRPLFIVTGALGHLGSTVVLQLLLRGFPVRGLILPGQADKRRVPLGVRYYEGDVRSIESMRPLFENVRQRPVVVIHTAGIVNISDKHSDTMREVNVTGTKNIIELSLEYKVKRLVYVSSVHAIPEGAPLSVMREAESFSPSLVVGPYAKTKAEATALVLASCSRGLDAVVVHPSGIIGPFDTQGNHLVQLIHDYVSGKLPACVKGGYDFVDVRDVSAGCIAAALRGRSGQCYILSNRHYEIRELLDMVRLEQGGRRLPVLPMWAAKAAEPLLSFAAKVTHKRALYTKYSLYTLTTNDRFDHSKATAELGYRPRDLRLTIRDTLRWFKCQPVSVSG